MWHTFGLVQKRGQSSIRGKSGTGLVWSKAGRGAQRAREACRLEPQQVFVSTVTREAQKYSRGQEIKNAAHSDSQKVPKAGRM